MLNSRFQILLRRRQNQAELPAGGGVIVDAIIRCSSVTGYAEYVSGTVDNATPWMDITPVAGWYDFTDYIEGSEKLSFTWDKINSGDSSNSVTNQDGSNYDKGLTADLMFFDNAWAFIDDWLLSTECSILNAVEVKIIDLIARNLQPDPAGNYRIFEIKSDNLDYAPVDEPCQFHIKLREQDNNWHCIHKTFIWDDWQGWFKTGGKDHPCFLTCIEPRPRLVQSVRMALMLLYQSSLIMTLIDFIVDIFDLKEDARRVLNANRFVDAPLVRTYIENVAGKCGLSMDTIFDAGQPWENLCLYYPQAGFMHESDSDAVASPSLVYHFDNRWLITIAELFDKLKVVFAAEWYVTPLNTIVFKHKKDLINLLPIYDFTLPGAEPIYDLRYTFNGNKKPAYGRYEYQDDGSDLASQEMSTLYSDIIDYDGPANNPMLEGERVKNFEFAPTGFIRDGRAKDYLDLLIKDGKLGASILLIIITTVIAGLAAGAITLPGAIALTILFWIWFGEIQIKGTALKNEFVDGPTYSGAVRLTSEQTLVPRLILWDGINMQRAKAVRTIVLPDANLFYNPENIQYNVKNSIDQDNPGNVIYNYDMYFDGDFVGNMFSNYHDVIDNPLKSLETHQDVKWSVDLCEGMLNLFGVFENQYAQIGKIVKLETRDNYDVYVRIGNINVDYDTNKINLRGVILRRQLVTEQRGERPSGGEESSSGVVVPPDAVCLRWVNNGVSTAVDVRYVDCEGLTIQEDILVDGTFCAIEILDIGTGGNIQATDSCVPGEESGSPSGGSGSGTGCGTYQNVGTDNACIDYIDCNGDPIDNAIIALLETFCALSIVRVSDGANIVRVGDCTDPVCPEIPEVYSVTENITINYDASDFGFLLQFSTTGQTGNIDWGDGSPLEPFAVAGLSIFVTHTYATTGDYITIVYPDANTLTGYNNAGVPIPPFSDVWFTTSFTHSENLTSLRLLILYHVAVGFVELVLPPSYSEINEISFVGSPAGNENTYDFTLLPALVKKVDLTAFVALVNVTNLPATVTKGFGFSTNGSLSNINVSGSMPAAESQTVIINNSAVTGTLDLTICKFFAYREALTSGEIDTILIALDANGLSNGTCDVRQIIATAPSAPGLTAKANLIGKGWTVTTD